MKTKSLRSTERRMALLPADTMWAIKRGVLDRIRAAAQQVLAGEFDLTGYEGALASRRGRGGFELAAGNVAVLRLEGILQRHLSIFAWLFGGTSTAEFEQDFLSSVNDPSVSGILLTVNSPGGSVDGTAELSHTIYQHRGRKPIIALADSMAASAALWIASSADKLFVRGPTAVTGSIGVIGTHFDFSERERASGLRVTEVVSTPKKNLLSPHQSLSDEGRAWMQRDVDFIHAEFIRALARNRGVSFERAASWGTGETFFAPEAIRLGIADAANAPDALISELSAASTPLPAVPSATGKPSLQEMAAQHGRDVQARVIADIERWKKLGLMPADGAPAAPGPAKAEAEEVAEEARRVALAINPSRRGVLPENWKR